MSAPLPHNDQTDYNTLRRRWLAKYAKIQTQSDTKIRTVLVDGANEAQKRIEALGERRTFSDSIRITQLRMTVAETKFVLRDVFNKILPIVKTGQGDEAEASVDALTETDRRYLRAIFADLSAFNNFVESQRQAARNGVAHSISHVTGSHEPLSTRVYRTRSLANNWIRNLVNQHILRGDSAKDIAKSVRSHILPGTPGGTSYAALRLGRTELNNAFHATSIAMAADRPWIEGMRWRLSATHEWQGGTEPCERLADRIFPVDSVPKKPHPQCRCFATPEVESFEQFMTNLTAGRYREWTGKNAAA